MGIIFPLGWPGRIVLIIIAIVIGLIWSMLQWPQWWRKHFGKKTLEPPQMPAGGVSPPKVKGKV